MQRVKQLALNDEGFAFHPATGDSFQLNATGLRIVKGLQGDEDEEWIARALAEDFGIDLDEARQDVADFCGRLRTFGLL